MIVSGDTMLYEETMEIHDDTLHVFNNTIFPGDTTYSASCYTFEIRDNKVINRSNQKCLHIGFWIIENDNGTISKGWYSSNGKLTGIWKTFDQNNQLIKEKEYTSVADDTYVLKEVVYKNGKATIISEKTWFAKFYLKNVLTLSIIIGIAFFLRMFINCQIYNQQNKVNNSISYIKNTSTIVKTQGLNILCTFTFWWRISKLKKESKSMAKFSNTLSIIALGLFFGIIIGLAISGELK